MRTLLLAFSIFAVCFGVAASASGEESDEDLRLQSLFPLGVRGLPDAYAEATAPESRRAAIELGLEWLAVHQAKDGSWPADDLTWCRGKQEKPGPPDAGKGLYVPGVTGMVVAAFLGAGYTHRGKHPYAQAIRKALTWLRKVQDNEGCIGPRSTQQYIYNHAFGTLALVEAYILTGDPVLSDAANRAVAFSELARNPFFAWRYGIKPGDNDTSVTGCMMTPMILAWQLNRAAERVDLVDPIRLDENIFDGVRSWIEKVTDPDYGRVGYVQRGTGPARPQDLVDEFPGENSESMTAVGVYLRRSLLGWEPAEKNDYLIKKGAELMAKLLPAWVPGSGRIDLYYWYYATMAMRLVGGEAWLAWDRALAESMIAAQHTSGDLCRMRGSWDPLGPWGLDGGRMYATALALLMLETPDRLQDLPADRSDLTKAMAAPGLDNALKARIVRGLGLYAVPGAGDTIVPLVGGDDDALRVAAADALERVDAGRSGTRALGKFLDDKRLSVRRAAVRALVHQGPHLKSLVEPLQARLGDDDLQVSIDAARALGAAGHPDAVPALRAKLDAPVIRLRVAVAAALWRLVPEAGPLLPALRDGLGSKHAAARIEAARTLEAMGAPAAPAEAQLAEVLKDDSRRVRVHAAVALWKLGKHKRAAVRALKSSLSAADGSTRLLAMAGLRAAGPEAARATDALADQLFHGPHRLRGAAARTLAAIGPKAGSAAAALYYCAKHGKPALREEARKACVAIALDANRALSVLLPALEADDSRLAAGAVLGLSERGASVVPRLVSELNVEKRTQCTQLLVILENIGPGAAAAVPAVMEILARGPTVQLRQYAAGVLGAIGPASKDALDVLTAALRDPSPYVRLATVSALGRVGQGSPEAVKVLARLLQSKRREDRTLLPKAAEALGQLGAEAKPAFRALLALLAGKSGRPRTAAIHALGRLVPHSLPELRRVLKTVRTSARAAAAQAIAVAGPEAKKAIPDLVSVLKEGNVGDVRRNPYGQALAAMGKPSVRQLKKLLSHKNEGVRAVACYALGSIGRDAKSALSALRKRSKESSSIVSRAAKKAIEQIKAAQQRR